MLFLDIAIPFVLYIAIIFPKYLKFTDCHTICANNHKVSLQYNMNCLMQIRGQQTIGTFLSFQICLLLPSV